MATAKRELLARSASIATRERIYRIEGGLEVDEIDHYEVYRQRVFYEDVVMITYHRSRGWLAPLLLTSLAGLMAFIGYEIGTTDASSGRIFALLTATPLLLIVVIRLALGVDEINVYSRRSRARLRFLFRKRRARVLFETLTEEVRRQQQPG